MKHKINKIVEIVKSVPNLHYPLDLDYRLQIETEETEISLSVYSFNIKESSDSMCYYEKNSSFFSKPTIYLSNDIMNQLFLNRLKEPNPDNNSSKKESKKIHKLNINDFDVNIVRQGSDLNLKCIQFIKTLYEGES